MTLPLDCSPGPRSAPDDAHHDPAGRGDWRGRLILTFFLILFALIIVTLIAGAGLSAGAAGGCGGG